MESLSLLRYWRVRGGAAPASAAAAAAPTVRRTTTTTIAASVLRHSPDSDTEDDADADADGPFFDLEFTVPATTDDDTDDDNTPAVSDTEMMMMDVEREFKFAVSSPVAANRSDSSLTLSPSDDLFFNGRPRLVPATADPGSKPPPPPPPAISKLRVLMLRLRRPKPETAADTSAPPSPKQHHKFFTKLEEVPIVSLFIRDSSSRTAAAKPPPPPPEQEEEARFSKEAVVQKYIGKIKPLYVRVSKRYGEKLRMSKAAPAEEVAEGSGQRAMVPALLRKRLGKSRSAPSAVVPAAVAVVATVGQRRRDDSLVQQEDGIQSAIAHCKRSFNAARGAAGAAAGDGVAGSESPLVRSMSDPGDGSVRGTQF